jgi:6-phosphofructokinase
LRQGERIASELKRSNCHPRLIDAFDALQATLNAHDNVVEIGVMSRSCMSITLASADELATTLFELINAHIHGVYDFLAQHEDWRKFVENALHAKLGPNEVSQLIETARGIAAAVSDEAIQHIALLAEEIREPDGKVAFALSRTLENFIAITVRALLAVKDDVISEVRKLNARLVISALVALPITVFGYVNGAEWVPAAVTQALKGVLP